MFMARICFRNFSFIYIYGITNEKKFKLYPCQPFNTWEHFIYFNTSSAWRREKKKNPNAIGTKPALTSRVTIRQLGKTTQSWVMTLIKNTLIVLIAANGTEPGIRVCAAE